MTKYILGVDVGMNGALSLYSDYELIIKDMPTFKRNKTNRVDCHDLNDFIFNHHTEINHAYIEQVNAFGMGASSAYNFGWSCGVIEALICAHNIPFTYVTPQKWKKTMDCPKDKDAARMRATQLMPEYKNKWPLKKHDGRAESALIAMYGYRELNK